ncbi:MAG: M48 family metalloprotease [Candidatus Omnitrophica bacterium]|nr:M48 family metalloprotease [Candidatus Omnitrophota bacterium]
MNFLKLIVSLILFVSAGCQSIPSLSSFENKSITQQFINMTSAGEPYEKRLFGKDSDIWLVKQDVDDAVLINYLQSVMDKLWPFYKDKVQHYYVHIDNNAYVQSLIVLPPSNQVYISYSLLNVIANEDELAGLLAHEIGHIASYNDQKELESKNTKPGLFEKVLDMSGVDNGLKGWLTKQKNEINLSQISQDIEIKADLYGAELSRQAGYDPFALCDLLNRLAQIKGDSLVYQLSKLKGTHPPLKYRAQFLEKELIGKGYKRIGQLDSNAYQKMIARLWKNSFGQAGPDAAKNEFYDDWQKIRAIKSKIAASQRVSSEEFLGLMNGLQGLCLKYNITRQDLQLPFKDDFNQRYFVGEKIYVPFPQAGRASFIEALKQEINDILSLTAQMGVGAIPVIGNAISLNEVLVGKDFFTGTELTTMERTISCIGVFIDNSKAWREVSKGVEKELANEVVVKISHNIPESKKSLKAAEEVYEDTLAETSFIAHEPVKEGQKVYRIYGEDVDKNIDRNGALPFKHSWTPIDPRTMSNPRSKLGLPTVEGFRNEGRFVIEGRIVNIKGIKVKSADELHGNPGKETEYLVPNPESQIKIERVSGVNPEF